ncbi:MAG: DHHW family protein [Candidatus Fimenecus sp.]
MRNDKKIKKKRIVVYLAQMCVFAVTLAVLAVTGLLMPLRPEYSESEKRKLAEFPHFTFKTFFDGSYFQGIGDWYSDTYPGRETLVGLNSKIKSRYGISSVEIHGDVVEGDEIPDAYVPPTGDDLTLPEDTDENFDEIIKEVDTQSLGAVFVAGNVGYEYYNFSKEQADRYITLINKQASNLSDTANVYAMVVPTSIGITLPDNFKNTINSSDQKKAIDYFYSGIGGNVKAINIYNTLMSHRSEYIYFNTDHHWTTLGAYYAYEQFAKSAGIECKPLSAYKKAEYSGFLGSFYNDTGKLPELEKNPDTVVAYIPNENAKMVYTTTKGDKISWPIVNDVSSYPQSIKYSAFIGGDNPFTEITNPDITDNSSIVVVKESFGNAFVPFLVENYHKVYVIDYRYYSGSVSGFAKQNGVKDVLYINNISATRNKSLINKLQNTL